MWQELEKKTCSVCILHILAHSESNHNQLYVCHTAVISLCFSFIFCYSVPNVCCLAMHRWFIYFECKWPKTCAKVAVCIFAHFGQFCVKSQSVKRLPQSKFWICARYLCSFILCLICLMWTCKDNFQILKRSGQKLAHNWQFAYLHILVSQISIS